MQLNKLFGVYFLIDSHFHLQSDFTDDDIKKRFERYYRDDSDFCDERIPFFRDKWSNLSEFVKEIKLDFTRYYNKRLDRRGYFWGGRFKSVKVENGETLVNCLKSM